MFSLQDAKCYLTRIILQKQREKNNIWEFLSKRAHLSPSKYPSAFSFKKSKRAGFFVWVRILIFFLCTFFLPVSTLNFFFQTLQSHCFISFNPSLTSRSYVSSHPPQPPSLLYAYHTENDTVRKFIPFRI